MYYKNNIDTDNRQRDKPVFCLIFYLIYYLFLNNDQKNSFDTVSIYVFGSTCRNDFYVVK